MPKSKVRALINFSIELLPKRWSGTILTIKPIPQRSRLNDLLLILLWLCYDTLHVATGVTFWLIHVKLYSKWRGSGWEQQKRCTTDMPELYTLWQRTRFTICDFTWFSAKLYSLKARRLVERFEDYTGQVWFPCSSDVRKTDGWFWRSKQMGLF